MFFVTKQWLQASIGQTPEGRVYYPNGRAGYVLDAGTERNVARVLTGYFFAIVGSGTICGPLGSWTHNRALTMVVGIAAVLAIRAASLAYVLRHAPRSAFPFSREGAVARAAATYGAERIWAMVFAVCLGVPMMAYAVRDDPPWERAATMVIALAAAVYACVFAVRVLRAMAAAPGRNAGKPPNAS